jgi:AcrR family transcriptional regulator
MREIAAELGMHAGNLYYYFRSKEELVAFCQRDALANLLDLAAAVATIPAPPDEKLRRLVIGHVVCLNETTPGSLAHLEPEALGEGWRRAVEHDREAYEAAVRRLIDDGVRAGVFRQVDPKVAAMTLLGALNWTVKWYRRDGARSPRQIGEELADLLLGGLAEPTAAPARREGRRR